MGGYGEFSDFFESLFGSRRGGGRAAGFRGQDYNAELHLSFQDAAKTHKQVLTVNGKNIRITVPAGVADGQTIKLKGQGGPGVNGGPAGDLYITFIIAEDPVLRLKGKGFPVYKEEGKFGDLIVTYSVEIPTTLTEKQKELFRELQNLN